MQRGIEEADCHAIAVHCFKDTFEVAALDREKFGQCRTTAFYVACKNHFAHGFDAVAFKEHVFCAAEADTLCAEVASLLGVAGAVGVGANEGFGVFGCKVHDCSEVAVEFGFGGGHLTVVNVAG